MDELLKGIVDAHLLIDVFGHWPSFHDGEIKRVTIDATLTLEIDIEHWGCLPEVDERGYFKTINRCLTTLRFTDVVLDRIEHFHVQNVLSGLRIYDVLSSPMRENLKPWYWPGLLDKATYHVKLDGLNGCSGDFLCQTIQVANVNKLD